MGLADSLPHEGVGRKIPCWVPLFLEFPVLRGKLLTGINHNLKQGSLPISHPGLTLTSTLPGKCVRDWLPLMLLSVEDAEVMGEGR